MVDATGTAAVVAVFVSAFVALGTLFSVAVATFVDETLTADHL